MFAAADIRGCRGIGRKPIDIGLSDRICIYIYIFDILYIRLSIYIIYIL